MIPSMETAVIPFAKSFVSTIPSITAVPAMIIKAVDIAIIVPPTFVSC